MERRRDTQDMAQPLCRHRPKSAWRSACSQAFAVARLWLPYAASIGLGAAALVGLGSTGVGGLTVAKGWALARYNAGVTLSYTAWSAFRFGLFGGDGATTASLLGGMPAPAGSRLDRAVQKVATFLTEESDLDCDDKIKMLSASPPTPYIIPTGEPNAFAAGRQDRTIVAVSEGLLARLDEKELCAVIAHELGHILHADVGKHMQQAAMTAGFAGALDFGWSILTERPSRSSKKKDEEEKDSAVVAGLALMAVGAAQYALGSLTRMAYSRSDEFAADAVAARLPNGAQALARALRKIEAAAARGVKRDTLGISGNALAALFIANGKAHDVPASLGEWMATHPSTERRIERLAALAHGRGEAFQLSSKDSWMEWVFPDREKT